jgi:hypothetical protein
LPDGNPVQRWGAGAPTPPVIIQLTASAARLFNKIHAGLLQLAKNTQFDHFRMRTGAARRA